LQAAFLPCIGPKAGWQPLLVNSFVFKQADLYRRSGEFLYPYREVGTTSITVDVEVYVQRNPANPTCVKVTEATLTYVAVSEDRRPRRCRRNNNQLGRAN